MTATMTRRGLLEPVFPQLARIGGSHAQREVFEDTLLESYIRAEQYDKAEDLLRERLNRRASVRDSYWLARTKASSGDTDTARNTLKHGGARVEGRGRGVAGDSGDSTVWSARGRQT